MEEKFCLNIAVTGEHGSGKSTFVNAIRGIDNWDERAAPTGSEETTEDVRPYSHLNYPNVKLWDLPGIGTSSFPAAEYLKKVEFERFDFFIIISADRFRENDVKLVKEVQKMGKKFYFVRSKIDNNLRDKGRKQRETSAERTLTQIREDYVQCFQNQGFSSPQVFLVSSFDLKLYDFPLLVATLERDLPELRGDAFQSAMPNTSLEVIHMKKKAFLSKIKYFAVLSAAVAAIPLPGVPVFVDLGLLVGVVTRYVFGFGLNMSSLRRVAWYTGVPNEELRKVMTPSLAVKKVAPVVVWKVLVHCASTAMLMRAGEESSFISPFVTPAAMLLSFLTTYKALHIFLDVISDNAHRVFQKTLV